MKSYIISIISAAMICAVVRGLLSEKTATGRIVRLLSGVLMTVAVIAPLANISFQRVTDYFNDFSYQAEKYVTEGENAAQESVQGIIKTQTQAYILDKATRMGLEIAVEVELDDGTDPVPSAVTITGEVSPYAREVMSGYIEDTLGISKEKQTWM